MNILLDAEPLLRL